MTNIEQSLGGARLRVFISYSRSDSSFVDELGAALDSADFEPLIDRKDIKAGEVWQDHLSSLIESSDTVVFVLSASSAASPVCEWEIGTARQLGKRIVGATITPLETVKLPDHSSMLHYIHFISDPRVPGSSFAWGLSKLVTALKENNEWLRQHSQLQRQAVNWHAHGRVNSRLLVGADIGSAKEWLWQRREDAIEPTELMREFIAASEMAGGPLMQAERSLTDAWRRRSIRLSRLLVALLIVNGFAVALAFAAYQGLIDHRLPSVLCNQS